MTEKKKIRIDLSIGDSREVLKGFEPESVSALVTDPPYGLGEEPDPIELLRGWMEEGHHQGKGGGFMNKSWDAQVPGPGIWKEVIRVLKPGAKGAVFAGTRTLHLMISALRFAGFRIETVKSYCYGSGFPKSHNVYKALKKKLEKDGRYGPEGEKRCQCVDDDYQYTDDLFDVDGMPDLNADEQRKIILDDYDDHDLTCRVCSWCLLPDDQYVESLQGKGTALKPAWEPIVIVSKPEGEVKVNEREILENYGFTDEEIQYIMAGSDDELR